VDFGSKHWDNKSMTSIKTRKKGISKCLPFSPYKKKKEFKHGGSMPRLKRRGERKKKRCDKLSLYSLLINLSNVDPCGSRVLTNS